MAFSGSISGTTFNALKVVDQAFRRCRLPAQAITSEMHSYALDNLYLQLSELANIKTPSWCIERIMLPFYTNQPVVTLPVGTVEVLNANYRVIQPMVGAATEDLGTTYTVTFDESTTVNTVGVKWAGTAVALTFQVSDDTLTWTTVGTQSTSAAAGEITWTDIEAAKGYMFFRLSAATTILYTTITLGNMPQEIPFGVLNRDTYVAQSNKVFPGRPNSYWFQRDLTVPVLNLWPAPNATAEEQAQLIVWRHRHIMDTQNLRQDVEVPQRWLEAIVAGLASKVANETPAVDIQLIPLLEQRAMAARQVAWDGDNDGSPTFIQPNIRGYTR